MNMCPNINVAYFGDFYLCLGHQFVLKLGSNVNRGAGYGLEIPVCFIFQGRAKGVEWAREKNKRCREES